MSRSIKMEEEDCPLSSDHAFFNHCLTTFYDQDSDEIIQAKCSAQYVFEVLEHSVDLTDTPLADIMRIVEENVAFRGVDVELVRRKVVKRKFLLKRLRAKGRKTIFKERRVAVEAGECEQEEEFKKQRNRMSAQISRDKKKEKVKALEELNEQLQNECERQRQENEQLRAEIERSSQRSISDGPAKSKLTKLLILLGIVFLFGLLKDVLNPQSSSVPLTKMDQLTSCPLKSAPSFADGPEEDKAKTLEAIELSLMAAMEHKGIAARIKERVWSHMRGWSEAPWGLTLKAHQQIQLIKSEALCDQ